MRDERVREKREGLDMLRGVGILGIVLFHMFPTVFRGGFLGVPLFFFLSGYLMVFTCEQNWERGEFRIGDYYKRRLGKIVPPLFTMVTAVCAYLTLTHNSRLNGMRGEIASIFLGCENWWQIRQQGSYFSQFSDASPFTHLWFLAVEIQFYLIWPLLFLLYKKGCEAAGGRKMCFLFLFLALLSLGKMCWLYSPGGDPSRVYYGTDTMAFSLLIGMFTGAVRKEFPPRSLVLWESTSPRGAKNVPCTFLEARGFQSRSSILRESASPRGAKNVPCTFLEARDFQSRSSILRESASPRGAKNVLRTFLEARGFQPRFAFPAFILVVCLLFLTVDGQTPFLYQGGMFLLSLFFAVMIHWVEKQRPSAGSHSVLSLLGKKSYGIYLWHYPIILLAFA